jgi:hypothetical protein
MDPSRRELALDTSLRTTKIALRRADPHQPVSEAG